MRKAQKLLLFLWGSLLFFCLLLTFLHPIPPTNTDLWRHLLLGDLILETGTVVQTNLLSYTFPQHPFINSHWLSEVVFSLFYTFFGSAGLIIFTTSILLTTCLSLFGVAINRVPLVVCLPIATLYSLLLFERSEVRPEIFSFLFLSLFLFILIRYREKPTKLIWLLIPLQLLWVNFHIYFFIGLALLLFFLLSLRTKTLLQVTFFSFLATLINPHGLQGAIFPLLALQSIGMPVAENQNIFFVQKTYHHTIILLFQGVVLLLGIVLILRRKQTTSIDWLLFLFFTMLAILHVRSIPLFVLGTFFIFTKHLDGALRTISPLLKKFLNKKTLLILRLYALSLGVLVMFFMLFRLVTLQIPGLGAIENGKPALDFFVKNNLTGPIYNNFDSGNYVAYRLYPKEKVFVDGRPEAYPKTFFTDVYLPMQDDPDVFDKISKHYRFNTLIISHWDQTNWKNPFIISLLQDKNYKLVYLDDYYLIMVRRTHHLSEITQANFTLPVTTDRQTLTRYLMFFEKVGWTTQQELAKQALLRLH